MTYIFKYIKTLLLVFGIGCIAVFTSCENDQESVWINSGNLSIAQWVESREDMTLLTEALKTTGMYNRLGAMGQFTLFAPNDVAMEQLYQANEGLRTNVAELTKLLSYHIVVKEFDTEDVNIGGFLNDTTVLGSSLTVDFNESVYVVNGRANIVEGNIDLTNGILHVIDEALPIPEMSLYEVIDGDNEYSIFKSGIDQVQTLKDYLSTVDVDSISVSTLIAVPNDVFQANGVTSLDELKAFAVDKYATAGIILEADVALERYMGYHVLPKGGANIDGYIFMGEMMNTIYQCETTELDFLIGNYTSFGKALINCYVSDDPEKNVAGTELDKQNSNLLHANGVMHVAKTPLEVITTTVLDEWGELINIVREFESNYYFYFDEITKDIDYGFFDNAGVEYHGLELLGLWNSSLLDEVGPTFINERNIPGWVEMTVDGVVPGKTYEFQYVGEGSTYCSIFVYLYPVEEQALFEADPYLYKLKEGNNEVSIHAEKGILDYPGSATNYKFTKQLDKRSYKIRFEVRGKNHFKPGKLVLKPV